MPDKLCPKTCAVVGGVTSYVSGRCEPGELGGQVHMLPCDAKMNYYFKLLAKSVGFDPVYNLL